jgi:hypothetical protein
MTAPLSAPPHPRGEPASLSALRPDSIILPLNSTTLRGSLDELVPAALHGGGRFFLRSAEIADAIEGGGGLRGEAPHRGLAVLIQAVEGLPEPRLALGIAPHGLETEADDGGRAFVVLVLLRPATQGGDRVPAWVRRTFCSDRTLYKLRTAEDAASALRALEPS